MLSKRLIHRVSSQRLQRSPFSYPEPLPNLCPYHQHVRTLRTIRKKVPPTSRFNAGVRLSASPAAAIARRIASDTLPYRTGVIATKKGMSAMYDTETGIRTPCTVLQIDRAQVIGHKTRDKNGYYAVVVGHGTRKPKNVGQAMLGVYANAKHVNASGHVVGINPKRDVREFKVRDQSGLLGVGQIVAANWFREGQFVDAKSKTKGKGFSGVMKRWGMGGQPASHGASLSHRSMGSAGGGQGSGSRVHPGKKMAGRMGGKQHTIQNLKVMKVDEENGLLVVNGCVSGPKGALVKIQDAVKKSWPER